METLRQEYDRCLARAEELETKGAEYEAAAYRRQARSARIAAEEGLDGRGGRGWDADANAWAVA